jgi:2'-hydroxyisoflavone reductase
VRLLVLGGTQFVGRALVEAALADGHDVTLFHRGRTNQDLFPEATHLHGDRDGGLETLVGKTWDACLDVNGYLPRLVRDTSALLRDTVEHLVFVSTISVYASLARPTDESGPLAVLADPDTEVIDGDTYGGLKALCEAAVGETFGDRSAVVRPGYVVGPHDHTGRFTWWVRRAATGGKLPAPVSILERAQFIDARDLGEFLLRAATERLPGVYNATGPVPPIGMASVLREASVQAGSDLEVVAVPDGTVVDTGVEFPLWVGEPGWEAWAEVDVTRALDAGLRFRPLAETVRDTLANAPEVDGVGPSPEDEARLFERP